MTADKAEKELPPIWILIVATATGPLALNLFVPSMPGLVSTFNTDTATVQLTLTLYLVMIGVSQLFYGPISDKFGRRPAMLIGLAIYVAGGLFSAFAWSIEALIAGRMIQAIGGCAGMVLGRAIIRDVLPREKAAPTLALVTMAMAVAPAIAPAIGGLLDTHFSWRAGFALPTLVGAVLLLGALFKLNETKERTEGAFSVTAMLRDFKTLSLQPSFQGYAGCVVFSIGAFFSFVAGAAYVAIEVIGEPPEVYGFYFVMISLGFMAGNFTANRLSTRLGVDRMILLGVSFSSLGAGGSVYCAFTMEAQLTTLFLPMALVAYGNGVSQPNAVTGAVSVLPRIAGTASGYMGFLQMGMGALLTQIVGYFQTSTDHVAMSASIAGCTALSALLTWRAIASQRGKHD